MDPQDGSAAVKEEAAADAPEKQQEDNTTKQSQSSTSTVDPSLPAASTKEEPKDDGDVDATEQAQIKNEGVAVNEEEPMPKDSADKTTTRATSSPPADGAATTTTTSPQAAVAASPTVAAATITAADDDTAFREVVSPDELEAIVAQNPVLVDIRNAGATAKREQVYPTDNTAEYVYRYLEHFPPNTYALPQSFRKVIKGLHAGHWLSKKIEEIKNRRWRNADTAEFGKLSQDEAASLQKCNAAFWELFIQDKPSDEVLKKRLEQYEKKKQSKRAEANDNNEGGTPPRSTSTAAATDGPASKKKKQAATESSNTTIAVDSDTPTTVYRQVVDPQELEAIVQDNPVLRDIRTHGAQAKREDGTYTSRANRQRFGIHPSTRKQFTGTLTLSLIHYLLFSCLPICTLNTHTVYPSDSVAEYVFKFLEHFPPNAFALPQTFRRVIKGLHAGHWLSKKIEEIKNRRWRAHHNANGQAAPYGKLSLEEVKKLQQCNMAFWETYIQVKPSDDVLKKRQEQYNKKTNANRTARVAAEKKAAAAAEAQQQDGAAGVAKGDVIHTKTLTGATNPETAAAATPTTLPVTTQYTEIVDPTATERLEEIVQMNPVLQKIREYGPTAKREEVFPTSRYVMPEGAENGMQKVLWFGLRQSHLLNLFPFQHAGSRGVRVHLFATLSRKHVCSSSNFPQGCQGVEFQVSAALLLHVRVLQGDAGLTIFSHARPIVIGWRKRLTNSRIVVGVAFH